jgi:hypothetical protein
MYTIPEIITIAKISGYLAANDVARGAMFSQRTNPDLPKILYMERRAVEWMYDQDPSYSTLRGSADYLYAICGKYGRLASRIMDEGGSGIVVVPTSPSNDPRINWIRITSSDFATATTYVNPSLEGEVFRLYANWITRYLEYGTEWEYLEDGGFEILTEDFSAVDFPDYELYLDLRDETTALNQSVQWENIVGKPAAGASYDLTEDTLITNPESEYAYQTLAISIKPNGFNYTWDTKFKFSFTWPEQPTATSVNTLQNYTFRYISSEDIWVCEGQSIDIPI